MSIWPEHIAVTELFHYAVFRYNDYSGHITDVDWPAVDILLNRCDIQPSKQTFQDWRTALRSYIEVINEQRKRK